MPGGANYKPALILTLVLFIGAASAYLMSPEIFTGLGAKFTDSYIVCDTIDATTSNPWVGESIEINFDLHNIGVKTGIRQVQVIFNGEQILDKSISVDSQSQRPLQCTISSNNPGEYIFQVLGLDKDFSETITVSAPDESVIRRPNYYYSFAEEYVDNRYSVPEDHTVAELSRFIYQLQFPVYSLNEFDCSDASAMLEWLLEGAGFEAYIVKNDVHMWVQVETKEGLVAVESTNLCAGVCYSPPGIVEKPDGSYRIYSAKYQMFLEWKELYPASKYGYDPDITFEEWREEYLQTTGVPGIPTLSGYYATSNRYTSPFNLYIGETTGNVRVYSGEEEFNWWVLSQFKDSFPFNFW